MRTDLLRRVDVLEARAGLGSSDALLGALSDGELTLFAGALREAAEGRVSQADVLLAECSAEAWAKFQRVIECCEREQA